MRPNSLPKEKKLHVLYRVEPGCLGPNGSQNIEAFCEFSKRQFFSILKRYIHCEIIPRWDKTLPELEYKVLNKSLTHEQAARYLKAFEKNLDAFEEDLHAQLARLIEEFSGR